MYGIKKEYSSCFITLNRFYSQNKNHNLKRILPKLRGLERRRVKPSLQIGLNVLCQEFGDWNSPAYTSDALVNEIAHDG